MSAADDDRLQAFAAWFGALPADAAPPDVVRPRLDEQRSAISRVLSLEGTEVGLLLAGDVFEDVDGVPTGVDGSRLEVVTLGRTHLHPDHLARLGMNPKDFTDDY